MPVGSDVLTLGPIPSFFSSFSLPDMLWNLTNLIWRKGTPFEAMTGHIAPSSDDHSGGFPGFSSAVRQMPGDLCTAPGIISLSHELHRLYRSPNIVRVIKARSLRLAGYVARTEECRSAFKMLTGKPTG